MPKTIVGVFSTALGLSGCIYGGMLAIAGAVVLSGPCDYGAARCESLASTASGTAQNGAIMLVVSSIAVYAANRKEVY